MKKKRLMGIAAALLILTLAACSNTTEVVNTGEDVEVSSSDLLVNSLEYLLNNDTVLSPEEEVDEKSEEEQEKAQEQQGKSEKEPEKTKETEGEQEESKEESDILDTTDNTEENEDTDKLEVTIYYGNGASDELNSEIIKIDTLSAENLIDALIRHSIVSLGTKVNSFEEQEADGEKNLYLDLTKTFRDYLRTMTQEGENVILSSITATFLEAYEADRLVITIEGNTLETDNAVYEEPLQYSPEQSLFPEEDGES